MKKILFDANILLAVLFEGDQRHEEAFAAARLASIKFDVLLTPATFIICNYYIEKDFKKHRNKTVRERLQDSLALFNYCTEDDLIIKKALQSQFHDKEDAVQYFSAVRAGANAILTYDTHDFNPYSKDLVIYNPIEFLVTFS